MQQFFCPDMFGRLIEPQWRDYMMPHRPVRPDTAQEPVMENRDALADLDQRFVDIYVATRAKVVERQKEIVLVVILNDDLMFYH